MHLNTVKYSDLKHFSTYHLQFNSFLELQPLDCIQIHTENDNKKTVIFVITLNNDKPNEIVWLTYFSPHHLVLAALHLCVCLRNRSELAFLCFYVWQLKLFFQTHIMHTKTVCDHWPYLYVIGHHVNKSIVMLCCVADSMGRINCLFELMWLSFWLCFSLCRFQFEQYSVQYDIVTFSICWKWLYSAIWQMT